MSTAHRRYESYHRLVPDDQTAILEWARLLDQPNAAPAARRAAVTLYRKLLLADTENGGWHGRLADLLWQLGEPGSAEAEADLAVQFEPDNADGQRIQALVAAGAAQTDATRWPGAIELLRQAAAHFPTDVVLAGLLARGLRMVSADDPAELATQADGVMDRLIAAAAEEPLAWMARAVYREQYNLPGADDDVAQAVRLAPADRETQLAAGQRALAAGDASQGLAHFELAAAAGPPSPRASLGSAWAWQALGEPGRAIAALETGLVAAPDDPWLLLQLAEWQLDRGQVGSAEEALARVRRRLRQDSSSLLASRRPQLDYATEFLEGLILLRRGQSAAALERLKPLLNRGAGSSDPRELRRQIQLRYALAAGYGATRNFAQAGRMFDDASKLEPAEVKHHMHAAEAWARTGREDWADRRWSRAQALDPSLGNMPADWSPRRPRGGLGTPVR